MSSILARARRYQSLTPGERAFLRLVEGLAFVALVGAGTACAQYLAGPAAGIGAIDWAVVAQVCAAGAAVAVLMALAKYFKAHGDPALADALSVLGAGVERAVAPAAGEPAVPASQPAEAAAGQPAGAGRVGG